MSSHSVKLAKALRDLQNIKNIQGSKGNWDYDPYMHGMFNGIELSMAIMQDREPVFKEAPKEWLKDKPMNLTDMPENSSKPREEA